MKLHSSRTALFILHLCVVAVLVVIVPLACQAQRKKSREVAPPIVFEQNKGQAPPAYKFLARESGGEMLFTETGMEVIVSDGKRAPTGVRIRWAAGKEKGEEPTGENRLPGRSNYLLGGDPTRWTKDVPQFGGIQYRQVYEGVDLKFHSTDQRFEEDFEAAPGAKISAIALHFDRRPRLTKAGNLELKLGDSTLLMSKPFAYQRIGDRQVKVGAEFAVERGSVVTFRIGKYDHSRPLVIDPVFVFSTFLAGTRSDQVSAVTTDTTGNIYVVGSTNSTDFPMANAEQPTCASCTDLVQDPDAYVSELDPTGHTLLYSTYIGGSSADHASSVNVDASGNIIVSGISESSDFPHAGSLPALSCDGSGNGCFFIASLTPDGSVFNYAGLVGGGNGIAQSTGGKLAVDRSGNAYLTGATSGATFQLTSGTLGSTLPSPIGLTMFVLKVSPTGSLLYSTAILGNAPVIPGGSNNEFVPAGISVDTNGNVTVGGQATVGLPTTTGVVQPTFPTTSSTVNATAGFILQLNSTATALNYATYITGTDTVSGFAVDSTGDSYITGATNETNLPVTANAYQKTYTANPQCSCTAGFIVKVDGQGQDILAATYLSGTPMYFGTSFSGIAIDSNSNVIVGGETSSTDFPLKNPITPTLVYGGSLVEGLVLAQMNPDLSQLLFGSYLGGANSTSGAVFGALTLDGQNNLIVAGTNADGSFPTTPNSFEPKLPGTISYPRPVIAKLDLATPAPTACLSTTSISFGTVTAGTTGSQNLMVTNCGNAPLNISSLASSVATITAPQSCGPIASGSSCTISVMFSPVDGSTSAGTLTLTDDAQIPQNTISVSGTGGIPMVSYPPVFSFGDLLVGTQNQYKFGLENTGTANWIISSISATGDFSTQNTCTSPIPPVPATPSEPPPPTPTTCVITITFAPSQAGTRIGTLTITDNVAGSPHTIQLSGNGLTSYPAPTITAMIAVANDEAIPALEIAGTNFFPASQVLVNGSPRSIHFESETYILANLTANDVAEVGELSIDVMNPTPGGGTSSTATATIYGALRNVSILGTTYDPNSGLLYASVSTTSTNYSGQVVAIDPAAGKVVNSWNVGNGPQQLAVSDDGKLLYVGLNGDKKVAQVSVPSGTVNFAVGLGSDPIFGDPMVADAIRVLPGQPHSWVVTLCATEYIPCGDGVAVFDDAVERPNIGGGEQTQPDSLLFIGSDTTDLFGTTFNQGPSSLYKFTINASGATLAQTVTNFSSPSPGGAALETDGTSIFVGNGQVIDPSTMEIASTFSLTTYARAFAVGASEKRVYFAGAPLHLAQPVNPPDLAISLMISAFDLPTEKALGSLAVDDLSLYFDPPAGMYRWGTNGLVISGVDTLFFRTGLTGNAEPAVAVSGSTTASISAGQPAVYNLTLTPSGGYSGQISFTCSNLPQYATCSINPSSVTVGTAAVPVTVTISTTQQQSTMFAPLAWPRIMASIWIGGLLALLALETIRRKSRGLAFVELAMVILLIAPMLGCGGGGGNNPPSNTAPPQLTTPKGTYTITLVASGPGAPPTTSLTLTVN